MMDAVMRRDDTRMSSNVRSRISRLSKSGIVVGVIIGFAGLWGGDAASVTAGVSRAHGSWAFDLADDRLLVGFADNVFFGQILASAPAAPFIPEGGSLDESFPRTAYTVLPAGDIKGDLVAPVTVIQFGGIDTDGTLMLLEDDTLMSVGSTYLLIASASAASVESEKAGGQGIYFLVAPGFDHPVANSAAARQQLQSRYSDAYANEVDPRLVIDP